MFSRFSWLGFRIMSFVNRYGKRKFTKAGLFAISALFITAALGLDTNRTTAYEIFTFLLAILIFSSISSALDRGRFSVTRSLPRHVTAGERFIYKLTVRNETEKPQTDLTFIDNLNDPRPSLKEFLNEKAVPDTEGDILSNGLGWPSWRGVVNRKQIATVSGKKLERIEPGGDLIAKVEIAPMRRGSLSIRGATLSRADIFGLVKSNIDIGTKDSIFILPKRYPISAISLPGGRKFNLGGESLASSVGDSEEFVSMRDYRAGDPLRNIHWKSWARTGKPVVKEFQEEFFARHALILDTFSDKGMDERFEEAVSVAASFVENVETHDGLLDFMFVGQKAYSITTGRGLGSHIQLLEILAVVTSCPESYFGKLRESIMERVTILSGCLCVFLDWNEERKRLVALLNRHGLPVKVIVIGGDKKPDDLDLGPMKADSVNFHYLTLGSIREDLLKL